MQLQKSYLSVACLLLVESLAAIASIPVIRHARYAQLDSKHAGLTKFRWAQCIQVADEQLTLGAHNDCERTVQVVPVPVSISSLLKACLSTKRVSTSGIMSLTSASDLHLRISLPPSILG